MLLAAFCVIATTLDTDGTLSATNPPVVDLALNVYVVMELLMLVPVLAVTVRRLHDTGLSGFWYLLEVIPAVGMIAVMALTMNRGTTGPNRFGPDPKAVRTTPPGQVSAFPGAGTPPRHALR